MALIRVLVNGQPVAFEVKPIPYQGVNLTRCVTMSRGYILGITKNNTLYSINGFPSSNVSYVGWTFAFLPAFARALYHLRLISKQDRDDTLAIHAAERLAQEMNWTREAFEKHAQELGIIFTEEQKAILNTYNKK